jgi:hypothetical protein
LRKRTNEKDTNFFHKNKIDEKHKLENKKGEKRNPGGGAGSKIYELCRLVQYKNALIDYLKG